jgi:hypothetical protein
VLMTGLAYMPHLPRYVPFAWIFVIVVLLLIALIFIRMYVLGDWFRRRSLRKAAHESGQRKVHPVSHVPEHGGSHGHRAGSRRRPNRH